MGANWGGALLLGGAETFEHLYRLPRLGAHRRPISQAIDLLVCAARLGEPLEKAMRSIGHEDPCDLICAQPGLYLRFFAFTRQFGIDSERSSASIASHAYLPKQSTRPRQTSPII